MPQDGKKMIFNRIQITEHFFGDLCSELSSFTKKKARLRDKYDELARIFKGYADTARFNETLFNGLLNYSKSCTLLADIKDMEVQRLQSKTLRDINNYEHVCKNARESLKHSLLARGKEQLKHRAQQRNSVIEKDSNSQIVEEVDKSSQDQFEMNLMRFERQKIGDIRQILLDFTLIQLKESVKSMEILTAMYNDIAAIDENKDLEEFEQKFLNKGSNNLKATNRSQSMSALATGNPQPLKRTSLSNSTMSLSSPNKDLHLKGGRNRSSDSESEDDEEEEEESIKSTEETTESEDEESRDSSLTKPSTINASSVYEDDDDDAVQVRPIKSLAKKNTGTKPHPEKRAAPVPQVRFSKLVGHMKK